MARRAEAVLKMQAVVGATSGAAIAITLIALDAIRPFSVPINDFIDRAIFRLCPFYVLGFSNFFSDMSELNIATVVGNAILYGVIFTSGASCFLLVRKTIRSWTYRRLR